MKKTHKLEEAKQPESVMKKQFNEKSRDSRVACEVTMNRDALFEQHPVDETN